MIWFYDTCYQYLPYTMKLSCHQTFFSLLFLRSKRIVRFFVLSKISFIRSYTNYCCFISYSGFGFSRNLIVFTRLCSNYLERQWAASISILESPMQIKLVTNFIKFWLHFCQSFWEWFWRLIFSNEQNLQEITHRTSSGLKL